MIVLTNPIGPFKTRQVLVDGADWGVIQLIRPGQYKVKVNSMLWVCPRSGFKHNVKFASSIKEAKAIIEAAQAAPIN